MRLGLSSLLLLSASLLPATAHADIYQFTFNYDAANPTYTDSMVFNIDEVNDYAGTLNPTTNVYVLSSITETYNDGSGPQISNPPPVIFIGTTSGTQTVSEIESSFSIDSGGDIWNGTTFVPNTPGNPYQTTLHASSTNPYSLDIVDLGPSPVISSTPEPSSFVLLGSGMLGMLGVARRRLFS